MTTNDSVTEETTATDVTDVDTTDAPTAQTAEEVLAQVKDILRERFAGFINDLTRSESEQLDFVGQTLDEISNVVFGDDVETELAIPENVVQDAMHRALAEMFGSFEV